MAHLCIIVHNFIAFISINIFFCVYMIIFIYLFAFPNISPNNPMCDHIRPFKKKKPNIFVFIFVYKTGSIPKRISTQIYLYLYLPKSFDLNIFVIVFRPANRTLKKIEANNHNLSLPITIYPDCQLTSILPISCLHSSTLCLGEETVWRNFQGQKTTSIFVQTVSRPCPSISPLLQHVTCQPPIGRRCEPAPPPEKTTCRFYC